MFSGGLDSTAMLVKLLVQSREELHVHHIHMVNREGRDRAEHRAVKSIVAHLRQRYRPFRYSESALDFSSLEAIPIDYLSIAFVACQVAIDTPGCTRIAVGALASDTDIANRRARQKRVFDVMHECYRARKLRAAARVGLPGVRDPQGRARCRTAARASGPDVVLSPAGQRLPALRGLQGVPRAGGSQEAGRKAGVARPRARSRESGS